MLKHIYVFKFVKFYFFLKKMNILACFNNEISKTFVEIKNIELKIKLVSY